MTRGLFCRFFRYLLRAPERARSILIIVASFLLIIGLIATWLNVKFISFPRPVLEALLHNTSSLILAVVWLSSSVVVAGFIFWLASLAHKLTKGEPHTRNRVEAASQRTCNDARME